MLTSSGYRAPPTLRDYAILAYSAETGLFMDCDGMLTLGVKLRLHMSKLDRVAVE